jgi:hypothetical protein
MLRECCKVVAGATFRNLHVRRLTATAARRQFQAYASSSHHQ